MKKIFTLLLFAQVLLLVAQSGIDKSNADKSSVQLKPVYRITHEGVIMYYDVVKNDTGNNNNGSNVPVSSSDAVQKSTNAKADDIFTEKQKPLDVVDVSPNPFKDAIGINIIKGFEGKVSVKILDLLGNTAYKQDFSITKEDEMIGIDLSTTPMKSGIYIIRIEVGGTSHIMRIVKR